MNKSLYDYCLDNDLLFLLGQWDKEKNGDLSPHNIAYASHRKIWWCCELNHKWQTPVYSRTLDGVGCPFCSGRRMLPSSRTLALEFPELIKEWHPTKNGNLTPNDVAPKTHRKVWWYCSKGHEWAAQVNSRTRGNGCPYCSNKRVLAGENDLATTHPHIASEWNFKKNGGLTPEKVVFGNHTKVWWKCEHGHEWRASILSRTFNGSSCPVCAGKLVIPGENDFASLYPEIAKQWHPDKNGKLKPDNVTSCSNRKVWWICDKGHEYQAIIAHRSQTGAGCPYCSNRKVLVGYNDLSSVNPQISTQWHVELNGKLTPEMVTSGSSKKVWWVCEYGHEWQAVIYSRTGPQKCGCPVCAGKGKSNKQIRYANIVAERKVQKAKSVSE